MYRIYKLMHHVLAEYNRKKYKTYEEAEAALANETIPTYEWGKPVVDGTLMVLKLDDDGRPLVGDCGNAGIGVICCDLPKSQII